jgi:hypothetical protein
MHVNYVLSLRQSVHWVRHVHRTVGKVHLENEHEMREIASKWFLGRYIVRLQCRTSLVSCRTTGFDLRAAEYGAILP